MEDTRKLVKIADEIRSSLAELQQSRRHECIRKIKDSLEKLGQLNHNADMFESCLSRGWVSAANMSGSRVYSLLHEFTHTTLRTKDLLGERGEIPPLRFLVDELKQLRQEFGSFDFEQHRLSVVTEPITLEGFYLGPFRIEMDISGLNDIYRQTPYFVIALDPHPAATDEAVTHPHVSNEKICEGDGAMTMRLALLQGRLCHFFSMIRSILNTYNPDSPFVSLDEWEGIACYECGYVMNRENCYFCPFCDRDYCEECSTYCRGCDESVCLGCSADCEICEERFCKGCLASCSECGCVCCQGCMEDGLCLNCKEQIEQENKENENQQENNEQQKNQIKKQRETTPSEQVRLTG